MERFIVGTGRCGSTLLSQMLAEHPGALSIFELFNGIDWARRFAPEPISGESYGALIAAEQPLVTAVLRRGYEVAEIIYPFETGRYRRGEPLPWILVAMLPRLAADPDALFDEVMARVKGHPRQPALAHHRMLFAWLMERLGKSFWLERSGSSFDYLGELVRNFPQRALPAHPPRRAGGRALDGAPPRLSPADLADLRRAARRRRAPRRSRPARPARRADRARPDLARARLPPAAGAVRPLLVRSGAARLPRAARARRGPLCGGALRRARGGPRERCSARSRRSSSCPTGGDWILRAAALVRGVPARRVPELARAERDALEAACRPGQVLLGRA